MKGNIYWEPSPIQGRMNPKVDIHVIDIIEHISPKSIFVASKAISDPQSQV